MLPPIGSIDLEVHFPFNQVFGQAGHLEKTSKVKIVKQSEFLPNARMISIKQTNML